MMQPPKIKIEPEKIIVGHYMYMSLSENRTQELWKVFGPRRKEIKNISCLGSYSIQIYDEDYFKKQFSPVNTFCKWAGVAVDSVLEIPEGMEVLKIAAGKWAVFEYQGTTSEFYKMAQYIYGDWLPKSPYQLDHRPHFEYIPPDYLGPMHPNATEEVWIPIKELKE